MKLARLINCIVLRLLIGFYSLQSIDESLILLEGNRAYDDNARTLFEEMIRSKLNERYRFIWFMDRPDTFIYLEEIDNVFVRKLVDVKHPFKEFRETIQFVRQNCVAKYCVYCNSLLGLRNKEGQIKAYLTHGIALKQLTGMFGRASQHDLIFGTSEFNASLIAKAIPGSENKIRITGSPRNDSLYRPDSNSQILLKSWKNAKRIIWMPTFKHPISSNGLKRNDYSVERANDVSLLTEDFLGELNTLLVENNACLFVKFHPFQDLSYVNIASYSNIISITKESLERYRICLYSFLSEFDALISDYSSVTFDYLLLDKPIGYDLTDFDDYSAGRGFSVENPLEYMPGHHIFTRRDFYSFIDDVCKGNDPYKQFRNQINTLFNYYNDDEASKRVLSELGIEYGGK